MIKKTEVSVDYDLSFKSFKYQTILFLQQQQQ